MGLPSNIARWGAENTVAAPDSNHFTGSLVLRITFASEYFATSSRQNMQPG
jgi:hypothetical protein